ncbi:putative FtsX-related transmembrane transport protein [Arcticibacter svalbardensis MN12-7]|uniref:Putative FtsX-related transmembrane transport protein n=2 Tax=Arcticibacter TaxID=1288026 RepID=R9GV11_9SPHI|nr:putative FtsX-related transmembrane transport protein [Arcticibacter svalbardensis MN12-7]
MSRHKFISFINISGLTIGLICCLLILIYIIQEVCYDRFNANAQDIYPVTRSFNSADGVVNLNLGTVAPPFGPLLKNEFQKLSVLFGLILMTMGMPVMMAILGADLSKVPDYWNLVFPVMLFFFFAFAWRVLKYYDKILEKAEDILSDLNK